MTENAILGPAQGPLTIAVLVLPHCSILEVASVLDPLRAANRHLGQAAFRWRVVSPDGGPVPLTCGIELPAEGPLQAVDGQALVVVAGYRLAEVATRGLIRDLARMAPRFAMLGGIDAGPWVLARAGLLAGHRATVHWEDLDDLAAAHPEVEVVPDRWVIDRGRMTAGGAAPAAELMLHLIARRHGAPLAAQVAASFLTSPRPGHEPQVASPTTPGLDPRVAAAMARLAARVEVPEPAALTAAAVGLSPRRLETLFRAALGITPGAYALRLRLQAARRLLSETRHPLAEIALRTGFSSPATLSRAFRKSYACAPGALRKKSTI